MLLVGQVLKLYCGGYFGRDFYGGRVEAIGFDWVVARNDFNNLPAFAWFEGGIAAHADKIKRWEEETENAD